MRTAKVSLGRQGFTLVELLVVIAIISVLVSLLLPALARARKQAVGLVCRTQLKDIGIMYKLYMEDNDDRTVPNVYSMGRWSTVLGKYYMRYSSKVGGIRHSTDIFYCPIEWEKRLATKAAGITGQPNFGMDYQPNNMLTDGDTVSPHLAIFSKSTSWKMPATLPLVHDSSSDLTFAEMYDNPRKHMYPHNTLLKYGWNGGENDPRNLVTYRFGPAANHGPGINYLFCDMHVKMTLWPYEGTMANPEPPEYYYKFWHPLRNLSVPTHH